MKKRLQLQNKTLALTADCMQIKSFTHELSSLNSTSEWRGPHKSTNAMFLYLEIVAASKMAFSRSSVYLSGPVWSGLKIRKTTNTNHCRHSTTTNTSSQYCHKGWGQILFLHADTHSQRRAYNGARGGSYLCLGKWKSCHITCGSEIHTTV